MNTLQSTHETSSTAVIPYSQTGASLTTQTSTSLVPASTALGLTDGSFTGLAVTVIGILVLFTAWVTLKPRMTYRRKQATFSGASLAGTPAPAPQLETPKTMPSPGGNRITVDRKEFEGFLAENQKFLDRSQALMNRFNELENENEQLGVELQATKTRLRAIESNMANNTREGDESLRKAWEIMSRLAEEADKRIPK
jgi:hypothetical protein